MIQFSLRRVRRQFGLMAVLLMGFLGSLPAQGSIRGWGLHFFDTESRNDRIVEIAARSYATAVRRADGRIVVQGGLNSPSMVDAPSAPAGDPIVAMRLASTYGLALLASGQILSWGATLFPWSPVFVPPLPVGLAYRSISAVNFHAAATRSDGSVVLWGDNSSGQCNVPPLPAGVSIAAIDVGSFTTVALLSDGSVLAWGDPLTGISNVPALPVGLKYVAVDAGG